MKTDCRYRFMAALLVMLLPGGLLGEDAPAAEIESVIPGRTWDRLAPGEAGLDAGRLRAFSAYTGGFGCVVRYG